MAGLKSWLARQLAKPLAYAAEHFNLPFLNKFTESNNTASEAMAEALARAEKSMVKYPESGTLLTPISPPISPPEIGRHTPTSAVEAKAASKSIRITSNSEAYAAAQQVKALAKTVHDAPRQVAELARQTLAIFGSKTAGGPYVAEVTKALFHSLSDAKSPTVQHSLQRLTDTGRSLIEERMKHRSDSIIHLGSSLERDARMHESRSLISANIGDARALMESGATGSQRHFALSTILKNVSDIAGKQGQNAAAVLLARAAQTPALLKELTEFAARNNEGPHLFTPDTLATIAKANSAAFAKDETWRGTLTHALDTQFGNNAKDQLNWITANATGLPGAALGNEMVERALRFSSHMPIDPARPLHTTLVNVAKNVHLSPETEAKLTKFWLETNTNLRCQGYAQQANQSTLQAIAVSGPKSMLAILATAELRIAPSLDVKPDRLTPRQAAEPISEPHIPCTLDEKHIQESLMATIPNPQKLREIGETDQPVIPLPTGNGTTIPAFHFITPATAHRFLGNTAQKPGNDPRITTTDNMHDISRQVRQPAINL